MKTVPQQYRGMAKKDEMMPGHILASVGESNPVQLTVSLSSTPDALKVTPQDAGFFNLIIGVHLFVGNLFTILLFRIIYKSGPWKPINIMIFVDQSVRIVTMTWNLLVVAPSMSLMWSNGPALASYTGTAFCQVSLFVATVGVIFNLAYGTGIALLRYLFIRHPLIVKAWKALSPRTKKYMQSKRCLVLSFKVILGTQTS